jgi:hypothetical protein
MYYLPSTERRNSNNTTTLNQSGDNTSRLVKPTSICPSLHMKTHFKAATSIFMNHKGSLEDKD